MDTGTVLKNISNVMKSVTKEARLGIYLLVFQEQACPIVYQLNSILITLL